MAVPGWGDIYDELGVTPVINAIGSVTLLGGSQTSPTVRDAMERANSAYVPLAELEDKAGGLIADGQHMDFLVNNHVFAFATHHSRSVDKRFAILDADHVEKQRAGLPALFQRQLIRVAADG